MTRDLQVNLRLTKAERARLDRLARHYGLGCGALIRMLLKQAAEDGSRVEVLEEEVKRLRTNIATLQGAIEGLYRA